MIHYDVENRMRYIGCVWMRRLRIIRVKPIVARWNELKCVEGVARPRPRPGPGLVVNEIVDIIVGRMFGKRQIGKVGSIGRDNPDDVVANEVFVQVQGNEQCHNIFHNRVVYV